MIQRWKQQQQHQEQKIGLISKEETLMTVAPQLWHRNGSCPNGTSPIRRIREKDLLKASSIKDYGRKQFKKFFIIRLTILKEMKTFN